jgi:hypothetical protein
MTTPKINMERLVEVIRKTQMALQNAGDQMVDSMWEITASPHRPIDVGDEDHPEPWCMTCHVDFPCPKLQRLNAQRAEIFDKRAKRNQQ